MSHKKYLGNWVPKHIAYYMHLDDPKVIKALTFRFKGMALIYGIRCGPVGKIYIGSTLSPALRFHKHLITGEQSNLELQSDIKEYRLESITVHIFELVKLNYKNSYDANKFILRQVEQKYLDQVPSHRLYNKSNR